MSDTVEDVVQLGWNVSWIGVVLLVVVMLIALGKDSGYMSVKARISEGGVTGEHVFVAFGIETDGAASHDTVPSIMHIYAVVSNVKDAIEGGVDGLLLVKGQVERRRSKLDVVDVVHELIARKRKRDTLAQNGRCLRRSPSRGRSRRVSG